MTDVYAPPAFQLYARDWLTRTALLTPEQKGALFELKAHAWLAVAYGKPPCSLPSDDATLARLSGLGSKWRKVGGPVREQFRRDGDLLLDDELLAYRAEIEEHHIKRSTAGRRGNEKRWGASQGDSPGDSPSDPNASRGAIANVSQNGRSASASASASKSGAEAVSTSRPADADAVSGSNGAAPPAPPADAGAAEDQPRRAPQQPIIGQQALVLAHRMPDAKVQDGLEQLRASLTAQGARLKAGEYVRAYSAAHLEWACQTVLESPPDKPEQLARWVLLKLRDTFAEWRSRDDKHAAERTAPVVAAIMKTAEPIDELGEAHRWVFEQPEVKRAIETAADEQFAGFPKNAGMLRKHSQWIDEQTVARWKAAGSPVHAAHAAAGQGGTP